MTHRHVASVKPVAILGFSVNENIVRKYAYSKVSEIRAIRLSAVEEGGGLKSISLFPMKVEAPSSVVSTGWVCLKDLRIVTNVNVKEDYITKVINGRVVALCQQARQCDSARVFTLSDKPLLCHGHGLVRGIDWEKEILYVITPVPSRELGSVDTLLYADWVPELLGYESELPIGTVVPYRTTTEDNQKQLMSTPRRRFNPLQLIKMSRNA